MVLFVLFMTLGNMFPLNRPEVFFITSRPANSTIVQVSDFPPNGANMDAYKMAFVMEYVRVRNDVENNTAYMRQKWGGVMSSWSTPRVYAEFQSTQMYTAITNAVPDSGFTCTVDFLSRPLALKDNQYTVRFRYSCADKNGQTDKKDYTIVVGLGIIDNAAVPWTETLNNPLGLVVNKYEIQGGTGDPLNTGFVQ